MMHSEHLQQNLFPNPQGQYFAQGTIGQGAYGGFGNSLNGGQLNAGWGWGGAPRQLSQQDVSAILQQIAPILPQIIAQAQQHQHPYQAMAAYGGGFGAQRTLSPQDVSEVVRQILPVIPQLMQSTQQPGAWGGGFGLPGQAWQGLAAYGVGPQQNPFQPLQQPRQLSQQDVNEIARQLSEVIQQSYGGLQPGQLRF